MSLTYSQWNAQICNLAGGTPLQTDANFQAMLPSAIDDAEQFLYRTLQLLNTTETDATGSLSTGTRSFTLPKSNGTFIVIDRINVITPFGASSPDAGARNGLLPVSPEYLDMTWNSSNGSTVPQYFAMINDNLINVGPWPDKAYQMEVVGSVRPQPLSSTNVTTLLSVFFPDLMISASMVFVTGYMKNYGMQVDDPKQGVSWASHTQQLLQSAQVEEQMKQFQSQGWSSKEPAALATPPRS